VAALREQVEALAPRIARADERMQMLDSSIRTLEEQLGQANVGREQLAAELTALEKRLAEIERADREAEGVIRDAGGSIRTLAGQKDDYEEQLRSARLRKEEAAVAFRRRMEAYPTLDEYARTAREAGLDRAMADVLHDVDPAGVSAGAARAREDLQAAYLRLRGAFEEMSPTLDGDLILFSYADREMLLDELYRVLEDERARKEALLEEEDRKLIEQLMLREVVDAIRAAIAQTRRWVDAVNATLAGMQLFKDGVMRLHWRVRARETMDAFDPTRLDDLLTQRGISLDETRREELLDIFRTMVSDVRRKNRENQLLEDYRTALLKMVDYTHWYTLMVERKDETGRWVPLTRRLYGQGSGGRRTLDLLLPLVAAVSARLESADPFAPRLIGFDEAFAGVDDRNAAEIYGLLSQLGFCWIMATEKTAGVGPQVQGSATYELLTDGATVAPTLSLWDGERRYEFVGDELLGVHIAPRTSTVSADAL
ncbi:MAG TPA: SbcC/MukB-like Walker B domain-containing protein, partial [Longimicrobiaceae bacterium]|nr:SbcC/MukB-like Walker B domain-containing protein [Longimicrobiaceae bacterium]